VQDYLDETPLAFHAMLVENTAQPRNFVSLYTQNFTFGSASPHNFWQSVSTSAWRAWAVPPRYEFGFTGTIVARVGRNGVKELLDVVADSRPPYRQPRHGPYGPVEEPSTASEAEGCILVARSSWCLYSASFLHQVSFRAKGYAT
jgi:hypothetical protein